MPFSKRLYHIAYPSRSQYRILIRSPRRLRKTNRCPDSGSSAMDDSTRWASESKPLRMSVGSAPRKILTVGGQLSMGGPPARRGCRPRVRGSNPAGTRTVGPPSSTISIGGAVRGGANSASTTRTGRKTWEAVVRRVPWSMSPGGTPPSLDRGGSARVATRGSCRPSAPLSGRRRGRAGRFAGGVGCPPPEFFLGGITRAAGLCRHGGSPRH